MSGTINPPDGGGSGARNPPVVRQRVLAPPKAGLLKDIKSVVEETFFHDAPLRDFKGQTPAKKALLGIQAVFPIIGWAREYTLRKFRGDLIAGLTIASLCIPQVYYSRLLRTFWCISFLL
jgi:high affinity sulfate transporter 1